MQSQKANWVQWVTGVLVVLVCLGFLFNVGNMRTGTDYDPTIEVTVDVPTASEIASEIELPEIPTAEEIAAGVKVADTFYSVRDEKETLATELANDELNDRDFLDDLAVLLNTCDGTDDVERRDITRVSVRDTDVDVNRDDAEVTLDLKVYFDNFGDEEETENARVDVVFEVVDLDRDDDYEDAEVDNYTLGTVYSCSTD